MSQTVVREIPSETSKRFEVTRSFRLDQSLNLPNDTTVLFPARMDEKLGPCTGRCGACDCGTVSPEEGVTHPGKFVAASSDVAAFVAIDNALYDAFALLCGGEPLRSALTLLADRYGAEDGLEKLRSLLINLSTRNFFADAAPKEPIDEQPPELHLYVTNRCNLRCVHCYMSSGEPLPEGEVATEELLRALDLFAKISPGGRVAISGGEALVNNGAPAILERARAHGLHTTLFTNGIMIRDEAIARRIVGGVDELQISLDGATAEANDALRGAGTFDRIVRAIRLVDTASRTTSNPRFRYRVSLTLTPGNIDDIRNNLSNLLERLQLGPRAQIRIGLVSRLGRAYEQPDLFGDVSELGLRFIDLYNDFARQGLYEAPLVIANQKSTSCGMGSTITVGADGRIFPCTITEQDALGSIRDDNVEEIMRSVLSHRRLTEVDNVEGCRVCPVRYFCRGMCRVRNLRDRGSMTKTACYPEHKRFVLHELIARHDGFARMPITDEAAAGIG
jgi:radical SAM protein with 4Fe4S-binding SPASM domain